MIRRPLLAAGLAALILALGLAAPLAAADPLGTPATPLPASAVKVTRNVEFADVGGVTLTLDIYQGSRPGTGRPAMVLIHGGAWGYGKSSDLDTEGALVAREGWVAFSISYRLASQTPNPWPDELSDVQRAIRWVGANAARYGVDPAQIALLGLSAGGHLAILAGQVGTAVDGTGKPLVDRDPPVAIKAVAAWSPPTDLAGLATPPNATKPPDCGTNTACIGFWSLPYVTHFLGCNPARCPSRSAQASPTTRGTPASAPIWFANATTELVPLVQAQKLDQALTTAGVVHQLDVVPGNGHAEQNLSKIWNDMMSWLAIKLGVAMPPPISFAGRDLLLSPLVVVSVIAGLALLIVLLFLALRDDEGAI
jgi:acetyl esterase/lipase